ncbi:hypothetical protein [Halorubrum ezzemoulense]|uniref:hypothetical protein n=1 Tax=Halorubrum ezzemoulense TaxID=337243 RepID=UPI00232C0AA2|nr:hypothetical protein [Halorubrum ezzemoulense]MDB2242407.1 hypothetical protein [Halorubrum ezzemoulense]
MSADEPRVSSIGSFELVNAIEVISISVFITGGAFLLSAWLVGVVGSSPATGAIQLAMSATGGGLAIIGAFIRWLLSRYG